MKTADVLDAQDEVVLAGDVRYFASRLPPVMTDKQRLAAQYIHFIKTHRGAKRDGRANDGPAERELVR
jgi:hypothetical protein